MNRSPGHTEEGPWRLGGRAGMREGLAPRPRVAVEKQEEYLSCKDPPPPPSRGAKGLNHNWTRQPRAQVLDLRWGRKAGTIATSP